MERYPRLQKLQRMLDVLDRTITEAERHQGDPEVRIWIARGAGEAQVELSYFREGVHDNLVLASSLAHWGAHKFKFQPSVFSF